MHYEGMRERVGPWKSRVETYLGPMKLHRAVRRVECHLGPKKVDISRALKISTFLSPEMALASLVAISELKNVSIFRSTPSNGPPKWIFPHQDHYDPRHINNMYNNSYFFTQNSDPHVSGSNWSRGEYWYVPELWEKEAPGEKILKDEAEEDILHVEGEHRLEQAEAHRAHLHVRYLSVCSVFG
jgi:hypothetical protein